MLDGQSPIPRIQLQIILHYLIYHYISKGGGPEPRAAARDFGASGREHPGEHAHPVRGFLVRSY